MERGRERRERREREREREREAHLQAEVSAFSDGLDVVDLLVGVADELELGHPGEGPVLPATPF